ncbi:hypothetical protein OG21DRAFT_757554 [Imleria badia]|nr:hypothetical protein OG21DRAFT_757554 [Imleria badia]
MCLTHLKLPVPPLDLHPSTLNTKHPVLSSPTHPTPPGMPSILLSPVGEFKGWFSNLFNWRVHIYVLCSMNNLAATRTETMRILEQLGVLIALEDPDGAVVQKHVHLRVEFSVGSRVRRADGLRRFEYEHGWERHGVGWPRDVASACQCVG